MTRRRKALFATFIEAIIAFTAVALFVSIVRADPPRFVVVNRMPEFTVTNLCPVQFVSYRNPVGHTHTCTKCGTTWDHQANPTHTCANCGGHPPMSRTGGFFADPTPRMVKVTTQAAPPVSRPVAQPVVRAQPVVYTTNRLAFGSKVVSNCANGNCAVVR